MKVTEKSAPPRDGETFLAWRERVGAPQRFDVAPGATWHGGQWASPGPTSGDRGVPTAPKVIA